MSKIKTLVVGSGGREHALGWALANSPSVSEVASAPGNPGLAELGSVWPVAADDAVGLSALAREQNVDLVVVGPEQPLTLGVADRLRAEGHAVFGPGEAGARLEASKAESKSFMERHGIPTAAHRVVTSLSQAKAVLKDWGTPLVVKVSGLAAGKGVTVAESDDEFQAAVEAAFSEKRFGDSGSILVLEKKLVGDEVSLFAVTDGDTVRLLTPSQDHKRALDGDRGPNTGGMGAYCPAPALTAKLVGQVEREIVERTVSGLAADGIAYRGVLFFGLMLTAGGPQLLEYNVRFGDPETQVVLPQWGGDLGAMLHAAAHGRLHEVTLTTARSAAAAGVVAAAERYPAGGATGETITGIEAARAEGSLVFHAGTAHRDGRLVATGGRVLNVVHTGNTLREAVDGAYRGLACISFAGMRYRRDIGHRALDSVAKS